MEARYTLLTILLLLTMATSLTNCGSPTEPADQQNPSKIAAPPPQYTMILLDKTLSLSDTNLMSVQLEPLLGQVQSYLQRPGDRLRVAFIHGNTLGVNYPVNTELSWKEYTSEELDKMGGRDQDKAKSEEEDARLQQQTQAFEQLRTAFKAPNPEPTNKQTDIWAAFELISVFFAEAPKDAARRVIFVSDMIEDVDADQRRNFASQPPKDKAEAEAWAEADRQWIKKQLKVSLAALTDSEVFLYRPQDGMADNNFQQIRYYWDHLLKSWQMSPLQDKGIIGQ